MPLTREESARRAGRARQAKMSPEQRSAHGRRAYLSGAVNAVAAAAVADMPELNPDQIERLRAIFGGAVAR